MTEICPAVKLSCEAAPSNRSVPAKQASKMLYICFAIWFLSLPPLSPAYSSGSSQESLGCSELLLSRRRQSFPPGTPTSKPSRSWEKQGSDKAIASKFSLQYLFSWDESKRYFLRNMRYKVAMWEINGCKNNEHLANFRVKYCFQ